MKARDLIIAFAEHPHKEVIIEHPTPGMNVHSLHPIEVAQITETHIVLGFQDTDCILSYDGEWVDGQLKYQNGETV